MRRLRPILTNVVIAATLCALIEGGSWAVIKTYQWVRAGTHDAAGVQYLPEAKGEIGMQDLASKYSSPDVPEDLNRNATMPGSPFQYESYVVYRNRPFSSAHVNIAADGRRMNARNELTPTPDTIHVWMFGSSAPWGATNGDDETIAAYLQKALVRDLGKPVAVANYAVVGYTSWQDMLSFAEHLRNRPKPDLVLFFNGLNDHYRGWLNATPTCEMMLYTAVGSSEFLPNAWDAQSYRRLVAWPILRDDFTSLFPHTIELGRLVRKYVELKSAQRDLASWKAAYRERRDRTATIARECAPVAQDVFVRNMAMAAHLAATNGIKAVLVQQPMLFATKKPLVGAEAAEFEHPNYTTFSIDDAELDAIKEVPSYRIDQANVWSRADFVATYSDQRNKLRTAAASEGARFFEVEPAIEAASKVAVFSSAAHFTFRGAKLIGERLAESIGPLLRR